MKILIKGLFILIISLVMMSFSQCNNKLELQGILPLELDEVYFKEWSNPARFTGSGLNLFIPIKSNSDQFVLDSVYFKDKQVKLEYVNDTLAVGRFKTKTNQPQEIVMSNQPHAEYGNSLPQILKKPPFQIKDDEAIISYKKSNKTKYFKISNIKKRQDKFNEVPM
ncbi:MAG: hypothetical protein NWQ07_07830 [Flaviramulus sp.]|nr:hypothetical protein [Flaviramulus sp.]